KKVRTHKPGIHYLSKQEFSRVVVAIHVQLTVFRFVGKDELMQKFQGDLHLHFRSCNGFLVCFFHFPHQERKYAVSKAFEEKLDAWKTMNSSHVEILDLWMMP